MFRIRNLTKYFGSKNLFKDVSFTVGTEEKIGLVGVNGAGKSTLLELLAGRLQPDAGTISDNLSAHCLLISQDYPDICIGEFLAPNWWRASIALQNLEQELGNSPSQKVAKSIPAQLNSPGQIQSSRSTSPETDYVKAYETFESLGGYSMEARIEKLIADVLPSEASVDTQLQHLSGGQRARLSFCRSYFAQHELLLLDEPSNNLDSVGIEWLESELWRTKKSLILASHDRRLLDRITTRTLVISKTECSIQDYQGNYSFYKEQRRAQEEFTLRRIKEIRRKEKRLEQDIREVKQHALKTEKATTNDYLRGRSKKVAAKAKVREARLRKTLEKENLEKPRLEERMRLTLSTKDDHRKFLIRAESLKMGYQRNIVIEEATFEIGAGDRIVLSGRNGSGKSTLLQTVARRIEPEDGNLTINPRATILYLSQTQRGMNQERSALETMRETISPTIATQENSMMPKLESSGWGPQLVEHRDSPSIARDTQRRKAWSEAEIRTFLHRFQFDGDDVHTPIKHLSAGEKCKLLLASFMLFEPDIIVLDEPTNHLDIESIETLETALKDFHGALLIVSHDREFVEGLAPEIFWHLEDRKLQTNCQTISKARRFQ